MAWLLEEHRMCSQHTEFDRRTFLVKACGPLTAMNDLPGREADRVKILGTPELAGEDSRGRALRRDEVNIIRPNHDDDGCAVLTVERIGEFTEFRVDHAVGDLTRNKVRLPYKVSNKGSRRQVVNRLGRIKLLDGPLI